MVTLLKHQLAYFQEEKRCLSLSAAAAAAAKKEDEKEKAAAASAAPLQLIRLNWQNLLRVNRYAQYVLLVEEFVSSASLANGDCWPQTHAEAERHAQGLDNAELALALAQGELAGALVEALLLHGLLSEQRAIECAALALCSRHASAVLRACAAGAAADATTSTPVPQAQAPAPAQHSETGSRPHALLVYPQRQLLHTRLRELCAQLYSSRFIEHYSTVQWQWQSQSQCTRAEPEDTSQPQALFHLSLLFSSLLVSSPLTQHTVQYSLLLTSTCNCSAYGSFV